MNRFKTCAYGALISLFLYGCSSAKNTPMTLPTIALYGQNGAIELNCRVPLTAGNHPFGKTNTCKKDVNHHFVIENPREGIIFTFFAQQDCNPNAVDEGDKGFIKYEIVDPIPGQPTLMTSIDIGRGSPPGTEVVAGIRVVNAPVSLPPVSGRNRCISVDIR
ncbi:hypothetical protein [Pseudomonas fluorescens]|uniref:hypothetical protein n=1 Tax=Pseudomonas fluorescens TaxID=294 RepID=UPI003D0915FD